MQYSTFDFDQEKILNKLDSIESNQEKIQYIRRLTIEIDNLLKSFDHVYKELKILCQFKFNRDSKRPNLVKRLYERIKHEAIYIQEIYTNDIERWVNIAENDILLLALSVSLEMRIRWQMNSRIISNSGYMDNSYTIFKKWQKEYLNDSTELNRENVKRFAVFYLQEYDNGSPYHIVEIDKIVTKLLVKQIREIFTEYESNIFEIFDDIKRKYEHYESLLELKKQTKHDTLRTDFEIPTKEPDQTSEVVEDVDIETEKFGKVEEPSGYGFNEDYSIFTFEDGIKVNIPYYQKLAYEHIIENYSKAKYFNTKIVFGEIIEKAPTNTDSLKCLSDIYYRYKNPDLIKIFKTVFKRIGHSYIIKDNFKKI